MKRRLLALALALSMILSAIAMPTAEVSAKTGAEIVTLDTAKVQFSEITSAYLATYGNVRKESKLPAIEYGNGNEWLLFSIAQSNFKNKSNTWLLNKYCTNLATAMKVNGGKLFSKDWEGNIIKDEDGKPADAKITDYEKVAILVTACGKDATNFYGCNLLKPIADYDAVTSAGLNAVIYALLALQSGNYKMPTAKVANQATLKKYLDYMIDNQLEAGGYNWGYGDAVDPDLTAMAITALAPYKKFKRVEAVIDSCLKALMTTQTEDGTIDNGYGANADSTAWVVIALCTLGRDPHKDAEFTKNDTPVLDALLTFYMGEGKFKYGEEYNKLATSDAMMALTAYIRLINKRPALFSTK